MYPVVSAQAGTISAFSLPSTGTDLASGIGSINTYLCALNFGGSDKPLCINGVPFQQVHLNGKGAGSDVCHPFFYGTDTNHGGTWSVSVAVGGGAGFADDVSADTNVVGADVQADGAMSSMLTHMSHVKAIAEDLTNGTTMKMNFGGLTVGMKYSLRYYYRQWNKGRYINFSFYGEGASEEYAGNPLDLDGGGAGFIEYDFMAATNDVTMLMEVLWPGNGPHLYGVTLQSLVEGTGKHGGFQMPVTASANMPFKYGVGWWIWASETHDQQMCRFWKSFVIPDTSAVRSAVLRISADNYYHVLLDGQDIGRGSDWRSVTAYDLSLLLEKSGTHVLAVEAVNDFGAAGVILGLTIELRNGQLIRVGSDASWRVVPNNAHDWEAKLKASTSWPKAKIVGVAGATPWKVWDWEWGARVFNTPKLHRVVVPFWQRKWFQVTTISFSAISVVIGIFLAGRLAMNSKERSVVRRERDRIARDLHDDLTAGLTQLVVCGELTKNGSRSDKDVQSGLDEICLQARCLLDSLKETIWVVNSQRDSLQDLVMHLCDFAEVFLEPTAIRCRFDVASDLPMLPCDVGIRRNLLLAVKEALCNAVKYSEASELQLEIQWDGNNIGIRIEDNGKGFDPLTVKNGRNGLQNMCQRAKDAGGTCKVISKPGQGCRVEFSVPLRRLRGLSLWHRKHSDAHNDRLVFPQNDSASETTEYSQFKST
jgi:signal transduction histidine kinase